VSVARARPKVRLHVVLLAGGSGTRFWPLSRTRMPKQMLPLTGGRPLLLETWRRVRRLVPAERIWVVAPAALVREVRRCVPRLTRGRLIVEPSPRDTAPAVTLACATVQRNDPGAVVAIFPTDHVIRDEKAFVRSVHIAVAEAGRDRLVCLGVRPHRPATGFGYLACAGAPVKGRAVRVARFIEKPDAARARRFLRSGKYLWNAGMFVWRAERFLREARRKAPGIVRAVEGHLEGRKTAWAGARKRSVDYAVMEGARDVSVVPLDAGWDDVGSWDAAARLREELGRLGRDELLVGSPGSIVFGGGRIVAVVDVPGIAVVDTPDALLIVARRSSEEVKRVVDELRRRRRSDLL
jgi:mannose-1-phosphate guanylyltransferase/mannose-6-phosphate isomerase